MEKLGEVDQYCTNTWRAFAKVLPAQRHRVGKEYTKNIEGVNTCLRTRNRRLMRRTTCFSKEKGEPSGKPEYHVQP
ncbi:hypothetical protein LN893_14915 [Pontibacter sp. XAAS-A31]|nr:hypothetical protein [Pontibacter harenae]